ncbi:MAG: ABC transporter ATP-binding protein [Bacteroidales bacterium]
MTIPFEQPPSLTDIKDIVVIHELAIGYSSPRFVVSEQINLDLKQGYLYCLIGPNGCGKSTLIRTLAGLLPPLGGEIFMQGKTLQHFSRRELASKVAVVFPTGTAMPSMTAFEVAASGRYPYSGFWGRMSKADKEWVMQSLHLVGIGHLAHKFFDRLSDGEKQKVWIASALTQQTPLILLDEPSAFLDFPSRSELMHMLLQLTRSQNKTILLSTHDVALALRLCDELIVAGHQRPFIMISPEEAVGTGIIPDYFQRADWVYNSQIQDFEPESKDFKPVKIHWAGTPHPAWELFMLRHCLRHAIPGEAPAWVISAESDGSFVLHGNSKIITFESLKFLSRFLRHG